MKLGIINAAIFTIREESSLKHLYKYSLQKIDTEARAPRSS